jgi:hypothetical protein
MQKFEVATNFGKQVHLNPINFLLFRMTWINAVCSKRTGHTYIHMRDLIIFSCLLSFDIGFVYIRGFLKTNSFRAQSYDFDLQRQRCKFLQRHGYPSPFWKNNILLYFKKRSSCKFKSRRIGSRLCLNRSWITRGHFFHGFCKRQFWKIDNCRRF